LPPARALGDDHQPSRRAWTPSWSWTGATSSSTRATGPLISGSIATGSKPASLLAAGDRHLVRQCDGVDCTMWFYDRTKAHRRRWCSMALCGNRPRHATTVNVGLA